MMGSIWWKYQIQRFRKHSNRFCSDLHLIGDLLTLLCNAWWWHDLEIGEFKQIPHTSFKMGIGLCRIEGGFRVQNKWINKKWNNISISITWYELHRRTKNNEIHSFAAVFPKLSWWISSLTKTLMFQVFVPFTSDLDIPNLPSWYCWQLSDSSYVGADQILWYPLASCQHCKPKSKQTQRTWKIEHNWTLFVSPFLQMPRLSRRDPVCPSESSWNRNLQRARGNLESIGNCALCKEDLTSGNTLTVFLLELKSTLKCKYANKTEKQKSWSTMDEYMLQRVLFPPLLEILSVSVMCLDDTRNPGILSDTPDFHIVTWQDRHNSSPKIATIRDVWRFDTT